MINNSHYYTSWWNLTRVRASTRRKYSYGVNAFGDFLAAQYDVTAEDFDIDQFFYDESTNRYYPLDHNVINEFLYWIQDKHASKTKYQVQQVYTGLYNFFQILHEHRLIELNPLLQAAKPVFRHSFSTVVLTPAELERLIEAATKRDPISKRFLVIVLLLADGALRNQEVRMLTVDRIHFDSGIMVIDQGQKTVRGIVHMTDRLSTALQGYLASEWRQKQAKKRGLPNALLSTRGTALSVSGLQRYLLELAFQARIQKHLTPHALRRTAATQLYRAGVDPDKIRRHLRHKNENTTRQYIHPTTEEHRKALNQSPMAGALRRGLALMKQRER